ARGARIAPAEGSGRAHRGRGLARRRRAQADSEDARVCPRQQTQDRRALEAVAQNDLQQDQGVRAGALTRGGLCSPPSPLTRGRTCPVGGYNLGVGERRGLWESIKRALVGPSPAPAQPVPPDPGERPRRESAPWEPPVPSTRNLPEIAVTETPPFLAEAEAVADSVPASPAPNPGPAPGITPGPAEAPT